MDYYNIDSEIIETLNILRPPVKRDHKIKRGRRFTDDTFIQYLDCGDSHVGLVRNYSQEDTEYCSLRELKSSLSLILQRTSQRQIIEQYSVYSCQNNRVRESPNKPTIKVTVIPKSEKRPLLRHLKKNKKLNKVIRATCSNQENSVPCKNVYIVVAGHKEKIYQIRATGSDSLTKHEVNDYYKQVYTSLNMEKKKKKVRNAPVEIADDGTDATSPSYCECSHVGDSYNKSDLAGANWVRIVGRLGLNEHDKYILKCAATVNDQPVLNFSDKAPQRSQKVEMRPLNVDVNRFHVETSSSESLQNYKEPGLLDVRCQTDDKGTMTTQFNPQPMSNHNKRMSNIEDLCRIIKQEQGRRFDVESQTYYHQEIKPTKYCYNTETQATQVDIGITIKKATRTIEQATQCNCNQWKFPTMENSSIDTNDNGSNIESDSPFVIISVFPNQEGVKTVACTNVEVNRQFAMNKCVKKANTPLDDVLDKKKSKTIKSHSRSPSPAKRANKIMQEKSNKTVQENKSNNAKASTGRSIERSRSPAKLKLTPRNTKPIQKEVTVTKHEKAKPNASLTNKQRDAKNTTGVKQGINTDKTNTRSKSTDRTLLSKRNFPKQQERNVDRSITKETTNKEPNTTCDISKVSVNIKNDNELYDVVFEKRKNKADLIVIKKFKDSTFRTGTTTNSLENFTPHDEHNNTSLDAALTKHESKINVRDSLELSHRREVKEHEKIQESQTKRAKDRINETDLLAPIKHYTGDDCVIYDPVVRDKEIRALLGIQRLSKNQITVKSDFDGVSGECSLTIPIQCERLVTDTKLKTIYTYVPREAKNVDAVCGHTNDPEKKENVNKTTHEQNVNITDTNAEEQKDKGEVQLNVNKSSERNNETKCGENQIETSASDDITKKNHAIVQISSKQKSIHLSRTQYTKVKRSIRRLGEKRYRGKLCRNSCVTLITNRKARSELKAHWDKDIQTELVENEKALEGDTIKSNKIETKHDETIVIFSKKTDDKKIKTNEVRRIASSVEIRYSTALMKQTLCADNNVESNGSSNPKERNKQNSIETLFRGPKKSRTPNLGTSALSLVSEDEMLTATKSESVVPYESKAKRPFLKRLMSCLVMRSEKVEAKIAARAPISNSSVNSYHFSTSLAGVEITSSLYDTTASFYSNHSLGPLKRVKRGFFSSVRGFLLPRKM